MSGPDGSERRREPRYEVRIEVDYAADETFLFATITDISTMGIFVATPTPSPVGTRLALRFSPPSVPGPRPDRREPPIEAVGEVVWTTPAAESRGGHAGMGIKFGELEAATRSRLLELVRAVAYLGGGR